MNTAQTKTGSQQKFYRSKYPLVQYRNKCVSFSCVQQNSDQSWNYFVIYKVFLSPFVAFYKNQMKNTLDITPNRKRLVWPIKKKQRLPIPINNVESISQKSMHWWHRIVIYCIGIRSILWMRLAYVCACKRYRMQTKVQKNNHTNQKLWHFSIYILGAMLCGGFTLCAVFQHAAYVIETILYASSWFYSCISCRLSPVSAALFSITFDSGDVRYTCLCVYILPLLTS